MYGRVRGTLNQGRSIIITSKFHFEILTILLVVNKNIKDLIFAKTKTNEIPLDFSTY